MIEPPCELFYAYINAKGSQGYHLAARRIYFNIEPSDYFVLISPRYNHRLVGSER
jgi:hypothetical protein